MKFFSWHLWTIASSLKVASLSSEKHLLLFLEENVDMKKQNFWNDHTFTLQNHDNGQRGFTCALLQHAFLLDNRILLFVIYNYWYLISHGQYNTIITDNLQLFIFHITWAIAFASFSCFSAIFRASEEIQDCLCHHFVGLWIL